MNNFEYPYIGKFYRMSISEDVAPTERANATPTLIAEVGCDIQEDRTDSEIRGTLYYPYIVYCDSISQVLEGDTFEADFNGKVINARVSFVITNELGTKIKVKDFITDGN